jgi:ferredoxin
MSDEKNPDLKSVWNDLSEENKLVINKIRARRRVVEATIAAYKEYGLFPETVAVLEKEFRMLSSLWVPYLVDPSGCVGSACKNCMAACPRGAVQWNSTPDRPVFLYYLCYPYNMAYCNPAPCISVCPGDALGKVYF